MSELILQRSVQFLYEEHLARLEAAALGCVSWERRPDDPWRASVRFPAGAGAFLQRSAYAASVDGSPSVSDELFRPRYQGGCYNRTRSVNQYLTHWIYPYRGKFHPQMVRALLNLLGAGPGSLVLDPFAGSGTVALEASLLGADSVALDASPLCPLLARVKVRSLGALPALRSRVAALAGESPSVFPFCLPDPPGSDPVAEFLLVARLVALSDAARRRRDAAASFRRALAAMLESVEAHAAAVSRFGLVPGRMDARQGDARDLAAAGVGAGTVDVVVTSPPYSIALDYVANDRHALEALGVDLAGLRSRMTGVRGRGARERLALYQDDLRAAFAEIARVLRPGGRAAVVLGDASVDRREVATTAFMRTLAADAGLLCEREIPKIVHGLYNVMKDERIFVFRAS